MSRTILEAIYEPVHMVLDTGHRFRLPKHSTFDCINNNSVFDLQNVCSLAIKNVDLGDRKVFLAV